MQRDLTCQHSIQRLVTHLHSIRHAGRHRRIAIRLRSILDQGRHVRDPVGLVERDRDNRRFTSHRSKCTVARVVDLRMRDLRMQRDLKHLSREPKLLAILFVSPAPANRMARSLGSRERCLRSSCLFRQRQRYFPPTWVAISQTGIDHPGMAVSQRRINAGSVYACHTRLTGASKLRFTSTSRSDGVLTSAGFISFAPLSVLASTRRLTRRVACSCLPKSLALAPAIRRSLSFFRSRASNKFLVPFVPG